jgi:hypothetical protein
VRWLLLVLLAGCAGPHREFRDGAPVRAPIVEPRTDYTPAGAGLPEYWGQPVESVERSPHARVLPQTPETMRGPGIWAAKDPEPGVPGDPLIRGVRLPFPPDAETDQEKWPTFSCAVVASGVLNQPQYLLPFLRLTERQQKCIVAQIYHRCTSQLIGHTKQKRHAATLMERWCTGVDQKPDMMTLYRAMDVAFPPRTKQ